MRASNRQVIISAGSCPCSPPLWSSPKAWTGDGMRRVKVPLTQHTAGAARDGAALLQRVARASQAQARHLLRRSCQRRRQPGAVKGAQGCQQRRRGARAELLAVGLLAGVVHVDAVGAGRQLGRQLAPDGAHQRLLLVVAQHLSQACGWAVGERTRVGSGVAVLPALLPGGVVWQARFMPLEDPLTRSDVAMLAPPVAGAGLEEPECISIPGLLVRRRRRRVRCLQAPQPLHQPLLLLLGRRRLAHAFYGPRVAHVGHAEPPPSALTGSMFDHPTPIAGETILALFALLANAVRLRVTVDLWGSLNPVFLALVAALAMGGR